MFVISLDNLMSTFTIVDAGSKVNFNYKSSRSSIPSDIKVNDLILGYCINDGGRFNLIFRVVSKDKDSVSLTNKE